MALAGQYITAAELMGQFASLQAQINALTSNNPRCCVSRSTSQSISNAVPEALVFDVESWDVGPMHSGSDTRLIAPVDGIYGGLLYVVWATDTRGFRRIGVQANGSAVITTDKVEAEGTDPTDMCIPWETFLSAGDFVEANVYYVDASLALSSLDVLGAMFTAAWKGSPT